ncbi:MAG: hypothetical protein ACSHWN_10950 [Methylophilaceae bacterium]
MMMNKKSAIIIGLQALLIVILFWMLVFYGKDEYEDFRTEQEEEIESLDRVTEKEGISIVSLSPAVQKNSGISSAKVKEMAYLDEIKSFGIVMPIDTLIEAKTTLLNLNAELSVLKANSQQHQTQYERLRTLNADDKNVSDLAVQQALALVNTDKANINSKLLELKNLQANAKLKWGDSLARAALSNQTSSVFQKLLLRKNMLIQVSLPFSAPEPKAGDIVKISPLNGKQLISAEYVSAATQADSNGAGKTFYFSAPAKDLRLGMRVTVEASADKNTINNGIIIPSNAVVWYAGTPWAYFKEGDDQFIRKPIMADKEVDTGWFNAGFDAESEVVVRGAQLLLSEEFKYLIKNENDD